MRKVAGYDFDHMRKKYDVLSRGNVRPNWHLLQQHIETKGLGWYPVAEREETEREERPVQSVWR